jgi:hypothetical protein
MVTLAVVVPPAFAAVTVYVAIGLATVGVPLMIPVLVERIKPEGSAGLTLYEITNPPVPVGMIGVIATPVMNVDGLGA